MADAGLRAAAVAWAEESLGSHIARVVELPGGLTSTTLRLDDVSGRSSVLRLMDREPWQSYGPSLTRREQDALLELSGTPVPAPLSLALDAEGKATGVSAHLMSHLTGRPTSDMDAAAVATMVDMLATIHAVEPSEPFRHFQSWAWEAKWQVPPWSAHPEAWRAAFDLLSNEAPRFTPTFLHRDHSHRNLLWDGPAISGVVDWVETSTGPAWLDAGHAATSLALGFGPDPARAFLRAYAARTSEPSDRYWLVMDAVGFLPPPGKAPLFGSPTELRRLDDWLHEVVQPQFRRD